MVETQLCYILSRSLVEWLKLNFAIFSRSPVEWLKLNFAIFSRSLVYVQQVCGDGLW